MAEQQNVDLGELALRLAAFAQRTFADYGILGRDFAVGGVGLSLEDFVWRVLEEYVEGRLEHDANRGPIFPLLATALRNDIIDSLRRAAHVAEETRSTLARDSESQDDPPSLDEFASSSGDILEMLDEQSYRKRVRDSLQGEPDLIEVVQVILDLDLHKPRDIAATLGVSVAEVQNRKKRLRRRFIDANLVEGKIA